uniref:Trafficking protein particle complex subunit 8-like n=1 Tax=Phallusia mammillata TaxID=59560 RepID=A0A6F9DW52_9ASCI|nr:trafficking protein particle complex subunit 8-like [Phallusia mammillata]
MSQCAQSSDNFIKGLFSPHVAVLCSQDAEIISQRNNLSFTELIQPFCAINSEIQVHDPSNQAYIIKDLHITMCDLRCNVPDQNAIKQLLSSVVAEKSSGFDNSQPITIKSDKYNVSVNMSCPWFDAYRETVTSLAQPKLHEFVKHCIACLLVVSSSHPEPLEEFAKLSQQQNYIQHQSNQTHLRWMTPNTLKYYVLLHDNSYADTAKAQKVINDLQAMYGKHACNMLAINSKSTNEEQHLPDPWSRFVNWKIQDKMSDSNGLSMKDETVTNSNDTAQTADLKWVKDLRQSVNITEKGFGCCLTLVDHENLRKFMQEFASQGLVPYMEKTIRVCNEQIASRKAIHKSFFRATRSLFGGNKAASAPALKTLAGGAESQELQTRKLADLFFLCQMYEHAYYYYHSARKDFSNEQAWLHAAGASEMAAFSNFMQPKSQRAYPAHYVDSALDTYSTTCSDDYLSLRCALVSLECLGNKGMYAEAASQLLKLSNDNDDDLKSAMLLEQIAQCFLHTKRPLLRKFAFYVVLAGHRYGKALQKSCALACYKYAFQVYKGCGWSLAEDHINFTIGRHSFNLKQLEDAADSFQSLLVESKQPVSQQALFLHEYLLVSKRKSEAGNTIVAPTVPKVNLPQCMVRSATDDCATKNAVEWPMLTQALIDIAAKEKPNLLIQPPTKTKDQTLFECVVGEQFTVDICVCNPLNVPLALHSATLIYELQLIETSAINSTTVNEVIVAENSEMIISFPVTANAVGEMTIVGVLYKLSIASSSGFNLQTNISNVELTGRQLFTQDGKGGILVKVCPAMPLLKHSIQGFPTTLLGGQIVCAEVSLKNIGKRDLCNLKVAYTSNCHCVFTDVEGTIAHAKHHFLKSSHIHSSVQCLVQNLPDSCCKPEQEMKMKLWFQGSANTESSHVQIMYYYEASEYIKDNMFYRTLCFDGIVKMLPSIEMESTVFWENSQDGAVVSVDVRNKSVATSNEFCVSGVFCDSRTWLLQPIENTVLPTVPLKQELKLCFSVANRCSKENGHQENTTCQQLIFGAEKAELTGVDLSANSIKVKTVTKDGESNTYSNPKHLVVAVEWCFSNDSSRLGQQYLMLQEVSDQQYDLSKLGLGSSSNAALQDNSQSLAALHQLIKWKVMHDTHVENNFSSSRLCIVPVTILVQNLYECEVRVKLDGLDSGQNQIINGPQFLWTSKALSKFLLTPHGSHTISMNACFVLPGVYNLNSFSVWAVPTCIEDKTPLLPQNCQYSCLLTVNDCNTAL